MSQVINHSLSWFSSTSPLLLSLDLFSSFFHSFISVFSPFLLLFCTSLLLLSKACHQKSIIIFGVCSLLPKKTTKQLTIYLFLHTIIVNIVNIVNTLLLPSCSSRKTYMEISCHSCFEISFSPERNADVFYSWLGHPLQEYSVMCIFKLVLRIYSHIFVVLLFTWHGSF